MKRLTTCLYLALTAALLCSLTSCAATGSRFSAASALESKTVSDTKLMVAGISDDLQRRQQFEEALCRELRKKGLDVVSSLSLMPQSCLTDQPAILKNAGEQGIGFVVAAQLAGIEETRWFSTYDPELLYLGPGNSEENWSVHQQQYIRANAVLWKHVKLEARAYDTGTGKPVWSDTIDISRPAKNLSAKKVIRQAAREIARTVSALDSVGS